MRLSLSLPEITRRAEPVPLSVRVSSGSLRWQKAASFTDVLLSNCIRSSALAVVPVRVARKQEGDCQGGCVTWRLRESGCDLPKCMSSLRLRAEDEEAVYKEPSNAYRFHHR